MEIIEIKKKALVLDERDIEWRIYQFKYILKRVTSSSILEFAKSMLEELEELGG